MVPTKWASRCTTYFHIWTGFLRTWVRVTSRERDSIRTWKRWRPGIRVGGTGHDGWLLLDSEERPPWRWVFQEFEEAEVQALKVEQWWGNMQFTWAYLYHCPPFSLQYSMFLLGNKYMLLEKIVSPKNIFRIVCVDKNHLIMPQNCNRFRHKIWFFFKSTLHKNLTWERKTDFISWFSSAKLP